MILTGGLIRALSRFAGTRIIDGKLKNVAALTGGEGFGRPTVLTTDCARLGNTLWRRADAGSAPQVGR
jgi:hypothetical protein